MSRSFGDIEAKNPKFGGMPNVLISTPDIKSVKLTEDIDFIVLGCDGIFDQMSNEEVVESVWITNRESKMKSVNSSSFTSFTFLISSLNLSRNNFFTSKESATLTPSL